MSFKTVYKNLSVIKNTCEGDSDLQGKKSEYRKIEFSMMFSNSINKVKISTVKIKLESANCYLSLWKDKCNGCYVLISRSPNVQILSERKLITVICHLITNVLFLISIRQ